MSNLTGFTATGDVSLFTAQLHSVILTGGADAATATIRRGGAGGVVIAVLKAGINTSVIWQAGSPQGVTCPGGIHLTVGGTTPDVSFETS